MAVVMAVSAAILIFCRRFRLPVVLGYILAGVLVGPHTPPYSLVKDLHSIHVLSEMGVIFLLFSIGLEFSLTKLVRVGVVAFFAATLEIFLMMGIGYWLGRAFGWGFMDSLFLGAILSISSTTIIAKVLMEMKKLKEKFAQVILGILIIEDLLAIVIIALLSGVASTGSVEIKEIGLAFAGVLSFVAAVLVLGFFLVPKLLKYVAKFESDEMMVITVLGLCFGVSLLAAKFNFSVALGAFLIGAVIAETKHASDIIHKIDPIRDMFTAVFFVSVGMLLSPSTVAQFWFPILIITLVTIGGKIFSCSLGAYLTGYKPDTSLKVGMGLAQIGEFSFIIARLGESSNVTSPFLFPIAVAVSGITTVTTPFLMRSTGPVIDFVERITPKPIVTVLGLYSGWFERDSKRIFRMFMRVLMGIAVGLVFLFVGSLFLPRIPLMIAAAIITVSAGVFLWGTAKKIHNRIQGMIGGIFEPEKNAPGSPENSSSQKELFKLIREEYPWDAQTQDFLLPYKESAANQTIKDLRLRSESGATIVAIYRDDQSIANPEPEIKLLPGDVLLLMGDAKQLKEAVVFLNRKIKEPPVREIIKQGHPKTEPFQVADNSLFLNKTLREIRLRRKTGATVLHIQKSGVPINNPDPDTVIEKGDVLMLFGWPQQLEAARQYLGS